MISRPAANKASLVVAAIVFLTSVVLLLVIPLWSEHEFVAESDRTKTTTETTISADGTETTKTTEETPGRTSFFDRALGDEEGAWVLRLGAIALLTFFSGAFTQRLLLADYRLTVGPIEIPALDAAAVSEVVERVVGGLPAEAIVPLPAGEALTPQPLPLFLDVQDPRARFLALRTELEARLRRLAAARGLNEEQSLRRIVRRLAELGVYDEDAADGLNKLLKMGDQVVKGGEVDEETLEAATEKQAHDLLYALGHLATVAELRNAAQQSGPPEQRTWVDELMQRAATDTAGRVVVEHVETAGDGWVWMPVDATGAPLKAWVAGSGDFPEGTARRDNAVLLGLAVLNAGIVTMPLDQNGVPLLAPVAEVYRGRQIIMNSPDAPPPAWTVPRESGGPPSAGTPGNAGAA